MRDYERRVFTGMVMGSTFVLTLAKLDGLPWANVFYAAAVSLTSTAGVLYILRAFIKE